MLLVAVLVVAITGFAIYRLHGIFGSHKNTSANAGLSNEIVAFNPKQVILEVFGTPGAVATINYLDVNAQPQQVLNAMLRPCGPRPAIRQLLYGKTSQPLCPNRPLTHS